ncbi:hypothetical protein BDZ89DRAFT_313669 [Hymenopellis radicata]|nr:hypothetical protein BDZ89DRAFT_313669 [Hymenopellis radicata]
MTQYRRVIGSVLPGALLEDALATYSIDDLTRALKTVPKGREKFLRPKDAATRSLKRTVMGLVLQDMKRFKVGKLKTLVKALRVCFARNCNSSADMNL